MGLIDLFRNNSNTLKSKHGFQKSRLFADSSSVSDDEKPYYQPDDYYTYIMHAGTPFEARVLTFEERKKSTYPSQSGLYVAEILLLEYCSYGTYPKPSNGYPGFWWFKYGIRDVGTVLKSLEDRGYLEWASKNQLIEQLKMDDLKSILRTFLLPVSGSKATLIARINEEIPVEQWPDSYFINKYRLTAKGERELQENQYVPYMHRHKNATSETGSFGETFTVWDMNKLIAKNNRQNDWKEIIGKIEEKRFGMNIVSFTMNASDTKRTRISSTEKVDEETKSDFLQFLKANKSAIRAAAQSPGDGYQEESRGLTFCEAGNDKEAIFELLVAIEKKFDAPALYKEAAKIFRKYNLPKEEIRVLKAGMKNIPATNRHRSEIEKRLHTLQESLGEK